MAQIQIPAQLLKVSSRADRTYKLEFNTRELSGTAAATFLGELMNEGWLLWSPNKMQESELPEEKADAMVGGKSPSQRMRSVIFLLWQQNGSKGDKDAYYNTVMEGLLDQLKSKLEG